MTSILITGAASGIGRAIALAAAARGWAVAALDIEEAGVAGVAAEALRAGAPDAIGLRCDVTDEERIRESVSAAIDRLGVLTGAVANAGVEISKRVDETEAVEWQRVLDVNLTGVFLTTKHCARAMARAGGGSIVCTSSPSAFVGFAGGANAAYGASKGGVSAFVRAAALDYSAHGVRVNAVVPGATDTPLLDVGGGHRSRTEVEELARQQIPLGRLARPSEIAAAVLWLLSDESSYVTGSQLVCDGGLLAKGANTF